MRRETSEFRTQFTVDGAQAIIRAAVLADVATLASVDERTSRIMRALAKADLIIVQKPSGDAEAVREAVRTGDWSAVSERDLMAWREAPMPGTESPPALETGYAEALHLIREGRAWPGAITKALGGASADGPEGNLWKLFVERKRALDSDADAEDEELEKDDWGVHPRIADGMAACHGCRVEISGIDDPHMPLTYDDDLRAYAVVTDSLTGRLVGMVECWQSEDGDFIVPRNWLVITLSAWDAQSMPKRAA